MSERTEDPYIISDYYPIEKRKAWITYYPTPNPFGMEVMVTVFYGCSPSDPQGPCLEPQSILEWSPTVYYDVPRDGKLWESGPPGWFKGQCAEAGCTWFYILVERMATGEDVPIEEIKTAYRANNGGKELEQKRIQELI